jgi:hypothetical protein
MQVMVGQNYGSYTFDASTGVITLSGLPAPLAAGQVKLIINAATNIIIFNLADPTLTAVVSEIHSTITLAYNTTAMSNLDPLQIIMEVPIYETVSVDNFPSTQAVSGSVNISNLPSIQSISGSVSVSNLPLTQTVAGSVSVSNFPSSQIVTGVFWQTTQPVSSTQLPAALDSSGNLKVAIENSSLAVTGTFWPTTQPVSGSVSISGTPSVSVSNFPSSQAVTGTFWQATQPVSISGTVPISGSISVSNFPSSQAVTGVFWQTTQPISGTVTSRLQDGLGNTLSSTSGSLNVNITGGGGGGGGVQYATGTAVVTSTGTVALGYNGTNVSALAVDGSGYLKVAVENSVAVTGTFWQATQPVSSTQLPTTLDGSGNLKVAIENSSIAVTGAFYQATQPVSGTVTANISGSVSNTAFGVTGDVAIVNSATGGKTKIAVTADAITFASPQHVIVDSATLGTVAVSGSFYQTTQPISGSVSITGTPSVSVDNFPVTQPVSAASLPLPTGAATAANQPALGTAGSASADVISIQGITGMTALRVDGSGVIQPISGSVSITGTPTISGTVNQGTSSSGALWSVQVDNSTAIAVADSAAETSLSTLAGAVTGAQLQVNVTNASIPVTGSFGGVQYTDGTTPGPTPTGTVMMGQNGSTVLAVQTDPNGNLYFLPYDNSLLDTETVTLVGPGISYSTFGYQTFSFQFSGLWAGNIRVEGSNDNISWFPLFGQNASDGINLDVFYGQGIYAVPVCSRYMRYNVLELLGSLSVVVVGKFAAPDDTPLLAQSFDATTGVQMNTNVINLNKDINNSLIISDAPNPIYIGGSAGQTSILDTQGYQSLNVTTQTMVATVTCSNDKVTWSALSGTPLILGALTSSTSAGAGFSFPCIARYIRFVVTTAGTATVFLRSTPWAGNYTTTGPTSSLTTNVATWAGTAGPSAGVAGVVAVGGNIAAGVLPTANPVLMAGIDTTLSATGTPAGLTRRLQTDTSGRLITASIDQANVARSLGSVSPNHNMQNTAALAIEDLSQFEGQTVPELLFQILIELKISNFYQYSLPALLTTGTTNSVGDEPSSLRNDPIATVFG